MAGINIDCSWKYFVLFCAARPVLFAFFEHGPACGQAEMKNKSSSRVNRSRRSDRGMGNTAAGGVNEADSSTLQMLNETNTQTRCTQTHMDKCITACY